MKIDLPLETWVATFEFLSRKQLAALLPSIGHWRIADRQFVSYVQFYLHKCGNVTLGQFSIESSSKGPIFVNKAARQYLLLAKVPQMPSNIKGFKEITINYYDQSVFGFLQEFHRNSLFTNVKLELIIRCEHRRKFDAMSQMMTQLLPSITSIESLILQFYNKNTARFLEEHSDMLALTRKLISDFDYGDWYRHWLHIPRKDGKPRVLATELLQNNDDGIYQIHSFVENIKKDFLDANQAVSFFVRIWNYRVAAANVQSLSLDNNKTQEKLVINKSLTNNVTISRYPMGAKEEWIKEMGIIEYEERKIIVDLNYRNIKSGYFTCSLF